MLKMEGSRGRKVWVNLTENAREIDGRRSRLSRCFVVQEWAKQTGRYRDGVDDEDYPSWKTRLRCALYKAPDIEELVAMRCTDRSDPYRVYRFKPSPSNPGVINVSLSSAVTGTEVDHNVVFNMTSLHCSDRGSVFPKQFDCSIYT